MKMHELFESFDPTKSKPLASATDADGYRIEIHHHVDKPADFGHNMDGWKLKREGTMYIFNPHGKWKQAGYWMNFPEDEWNIGKKEWYAMPLEKRAQMEADWQTHAYSPLKEQFK